MKRICLIFVLIAIAILFIACSRAIQKEYQIVDGKAVIKNNIEYNRIGDQKLTGLTLTKEEPNGVKVTVGLETQVSEGKLQIEGLVAAIGEIIAAGHGSSLTTDEVAAIKALLAGK